VFCNNTTATNVTTVNGLAANVITAASINADAGAEIADAVWNEATDGHASAGTYGLAVSDVLTDTAFIGAAGAGLTAVPWNAAWDAEVQSEVADALAVYDPPTNAEMEARTIVSANYATAAALDAVDNFIDTEVAAIKAVTDKLDTTLVQDGAVYDFTAAALAAAPSGGLDAAGVRAAVGLASANLDTQLSTIDTVVDSILVDTAEIGAAGAGLTNINLPDQTMNITGNITGNLSGSVGSVTGAVGSVTGNVGGNVAGSVGSVTGAVGSVTGAVGSVTGLTASDVGAIKAKTDSLTFTVAGQVDANVESINTVTITGDGGATPFDVA
jgi:hypothetical protein